MHGIKFSFASYEKKYTVLWCLVNQFNYHIPQIHVDSKNKLKYPFEFNFNFFWKRWLVNMRYPLKSKSLIQNLVISICNVWISYFPYLGLGRIFCLWIALAITRHTIRKDCNKDELKYIGLDLSTRRNVTID